MKNQRFDPGVYYGKNLPFYCRGFEDINTGSIVIASVAVCVILLISYALLYITEHKKFMLLWSLALFMFAMGYLTRYLILMDQSPVFTMVNYVTTFAGYWLFFYGTSDFFQKTVSPWWLILYIVFSIPSFPYLFPQLNQYLAAIPSTVVCGCMFCRLSVVAARAEIANKYERVALSSAFFLWAAAIVFYPVYHVSKIIPVSIGYLIVGCSGLTATILLQRIYYRRLHDNLLKKEEKIRHYGMYDKLTGVYNRAYFEEELERLDVAENLPISIIIADINGLKLVNDTFGHRMGDELLVDTVGILLASCRKEDRVARWGGDEFVVLTVKTSYEEALAVSETIQRKCNEFKPKTIPIHLAVGVAEKACTSTPIREILKTADERMYDEKLLKSSSTRMTIIHFLQNILWQKDYQTEKHVSRLKEMVTRMGNYLKMTDKEIDELCLAAMLHDIGKISIPEEILKKPTRLTDQEWAVMKRHTDTGYRITQCCSELAHISQHILSHHEWWNGCGYPRGLKGEEIPLYARIIAIIDTYDVMTHDRVYQAAKSEHAALMEIKRQAGTQFDPYLVDVFIKMLASEYGIGSEMLYSQQQEA